MHSDSGELLESFSIVCLVPTACPRMPALYAQYMYKFCTLMHSDHLSQ